MLWKRLNFFAKYARLRESGSIFKKFLTEAPQTFSHYRLRVFGIRGVHDANVAHPSPFLRLAARWCWASYRFWDTRKKLTNDEQKGQTDRRIYSFPNMDSPRNINVGAGFRDCIICNSNTKWRLSFTNQNYSIVSPRYFIETLVPFSSYRNSTWLGLPWRE